MKYHCYYSTNDCGKITRLGYNLSTLAEIKQAFKGLTYTVTTYPIGQSADIVITGIKRNRRWNR